MINQSKPCIETSDFDYISEIIETGQIAAGPFVEKLEEEFCQYHDVRFSSAVSSGTAALHLALLALAIGKGDEVILPSYTCSAVLNAINYTGASAVPVDIDPETLNISPETIIPFISIRTKAIIVTHTFGFPADINKIIALGIPVIEDCAHAVGAQYLNKLCGSIGTVSVLSLYATKMLGSGEGGIVYTNDEKIATRVRDLNKADMRDNYIVRFNYKMSDLAAGFAINQFRKLDYYLQRRNYIAQKYLEAFKAIPQMSFQKSNIGTKPSYYRFIINTHQAEALTRYTNLKRVMCDRPVFKPIHEYLKMSNSNFQETEKIMHSCVSIPIYPAMSEDDINIVIDTVLEGFRTI